MSSFSLISVTCKVGLVTEILLNLLAMQCQNGKSHADKMEWTCIASARAAFIATIYCTGVTRLSFNLFLLEHLLIIKESFLCFFHYIRLL